MFMLMKVLVIIFLSLFLFACSSDKKEEVKRSYQQSEGEYSSVLKEKEDAPVVQEFSLLSHTSSGEEEWEIKGKEAIFLSEDKIRLKEVEAKAKAKDEGSTLLIKSAEGSFDKKHKRVRLKKNVQGVFKQGEVITTIVCDGPLEIDSIANRAVFKKNVVVSNVEGKIFADEIEIFFDQKKKELIKIVAEGGVRIEREKNRCYGERAVYLIKEKRLILTGKPRVEIITEQSRKENGEKERGENG